ncbi:hypothetical protein PLCT2_01482 [Planctomycetaceae bacterium]|nr:hypothetical protein PLCT2_01482 [Planctomycetaceae bacterium]
MNRMARMTARILNGKVNGHGNCTPPLQAGLWDSATVCRKTKPKSSSILTILPILPNLQVRSTQPGAL